MKRIATTAILFFVGLLIAISQVPEKFNYQGILRNSSGDLIKNTDIRVKISLLEGSESGSAAYVETHDVQTNNFGNFTVPVGEGDIVSGILLTVNWSAGQVYLKTEVDESGGSNYTNLGTVQLLTVPYSLFANEVANKDDADADPANEIQDLNLATNILTITNNPSATQINLAPFTGNNTDEQELSLKGDTLFISNGNNVVLPLDSSQWAVNGNKLYYNTGNVGIGSSNPASNLEVKSSTSGSDALFQVINANNDTVFAVYPDGVKVFVDASSKGKVGGFAISGRSPSKAGEVDILRVTLDSTRIYVSDTIGTKGKVGGFAISGRSPSKGISNDYLVITGDSTRIYVNDTSTVKGKVGGFAISGRSPSKGATNDYFTVNRDSTRVYVTESAGKGKVGGFAISGRSPSKGVTSKFMDMTKENYFIGHESGQSNSDGLYNAFMGYQSGQANTTGSLNAFYGYQAGFSNVEGDYNTFLGDSAGYSNTDGDYNTFIGFGAGSKNTSGINNSFLGSYSGYNNISGSHNTFAGDSAGFSNTVGNENSFYGDKAGLNNTDGSNNVFIGNLAGFSNEGDSGIFIGPYTGYLNGTGSNNVFMGIHSGYKNNTGEQNVFIGNKTGYNNNDGARNVFIGYRAGRSNTDGFSNIFIGTSAAQNSTYGSSNIIIGNFAGQNHVSGSNNLLIGQQAGTAIVGNGFNTIVGNTAGLASKGAKNVFLGYGAGASNNISLGSSNVFIGYEAGRSEIDGSNKLCIENSNVDSTQSLIYGRFDANWVRINDSLGIGRNPLSHQLEVEGSASKTTSGLWAANSDRRIKTDIQDIENSFETILNLRPVKFKYTDYWKSKHPSIKDQYYYNFVAQEYQTVFPESVWGSGEYIEGDDDEVLQMDAYNAQIVTIKAVQELIKENQELKQRIDKLEQIVNELVK